jgi:FKBP-type peptidyl-prolyl cis-trans isomerase
MKKGILLAVYVVVAAAIIGVGMWYADKLTQQSQSTATSQQFSAQSTAVATTTQQAQQTQVVTSTQNKKSITTMDGLIIKDDTVGTGTVAAFGNTVTVNYTGKLDDGTVFDSSLNAGRTPFSFVIGSTIPGQAVIQGWNEGVQGMKVGGTRELTVPPALGYGSGGAGSTIPPNATLHFTITLLGVATTSGQ